MRIWNVHPAMLCSQHLAEEHMNCHFFGNLAARNEIELNPEQVELHNLRARHDLLKDEMLRRRLVVRPCNFLVGFPELHFGKVDTAKSMTLLRRCEFCMRRIPIVEMVMEFHSSDVTIRIAYDSPDMLIYVNDTVKYALSPEEVRGLLRSESMEG
jgi:hypothetical protein